MTDTKFYSSRLRDLNTLVIGGTSGIGFAIASNLLENGAHVTVASSRQTSLDSAVSRLRKAYPNASATHLHAHIVDMGSEESIVALLKAVTDDGKNLLDHIADTAGDSLSLKPLSEVSREDALSAVNVRFLGPVFLGKHAATALKKSSKSSLTLTGGVNSYKPGQNWTLFAGVGAAKSGIMKGLAVDLAPVRVNLVAPGAVETELFEKVFGGNQQLKEKIMQGYREKSLVEDLGRPEDVSEAYVYCMRDSFVTGQVILSEGGLLLK